ncbi:putative nuclease HARBI1 [Portunus trituberculatus]|uniref:putative nuclease HARBI1 n=1 Tax=Portunus trituberculatus TaxID=210409 RepID=UPI001E1CF75D|nr:putative nuclease HARBI1 [Portunus trituberculatus]
MAAAQHQDLHLRNTFRRRNVLEELSDAELIKRYRLDREGILFVTNLVRDALSTISRAITQTIDALADINILKEFISFPTNPDGIAAKKAEFAHIAGFPEVVGATDGTHVRIVAPKEQEEVYVNRKGYHSINVQVIFDANYQILDILAKWPGSVHDARILSGSGVTAIFERGHVQGNSHLLGDSGYPSKPWLLTPYLRPLPGPQTR